ncbi:hypothetical protein Esti_001875 [Eimeria stiedai]
MTGLCPYTLRAFFLLAGCCCCVLPSSLALSRVPTRASASPGTLSHSSSLLSPEATPPPRAGADYRPFFEAVLPASFFSSSASEARAVRTPQSYAQLGVGQKLLRRMRGSVSKWKKDFDRKRKLARKISSLLQAVEAGLGSKPDLMAVQEMLKGQRLVLPRGKQLTLGRPLSFRPLWLYQQVRDSRDKALTVRFPVSLSPPEEVTLEESLKEAQDAEGRRQLLPRAMKRHTLKPSGWGRLQGPEDRTFVLQFIEKTVVNVGELLEPLVAPLSELPVSLLDKNDKVHLSLMATSIAKRSVTSKITFPLANSKSFWLNAKGVVKFGDTREASEVKATGKGVAAGSRAGLPAALAPASPAAAAAQPPAKNPYKPMVRALFWALYNLWCHPPSAATPGAAPAAAEAAGGAPEEAGEAAAPSEGTAAAAPVALFQGLPQRQAAFVDNPALEPTEDAAPSNPQQQQQHVQQGDDAEDADDEQVPPDDQKDQPSQQQPQQQQPQQPQPQQQEPQQQQLQKEEPQRQQPQQQQGQKPQLLQRLFGGGLEEEEVEDERVQEDASLLADLATCSDYDIAVVIRQLRKGEDSQGSINAAYNLFRKM